MRILFAIIYFAGLIPSYVLSKIGLPTYKSDFIGSPTTLGWILSSIVYILLVFLLIRLIKFWGKVALIIVVIIGLLILDHYFFGIISGTRAVSSSL